MHHPTAGILLPFVQAVITGVLVGLLMWVLGGPALAWGIGIALLVWIGLLMRWMDLAAWLIRPEPEPMDFEPRPGPQSVKITVSKEEGHDVQFAELQGFSVDQLAQLAQGLQSGQTFNEADWTGAGRPFSKSQFHQVRKVFLNRGWLTWRNPGAPAQGVQLTHTGSAITRYLATTTTPPVEMFRKFQK